MIADIAVAVLSSLSSTSFALEKSLALMFAVTAARSLIAPPSIEVTSTESVLLRGANALPLSDTQCMFTETPEEQVCFGNSLPTRIRLLPAAPLNIGFLPEAISQFEYRPLPAPVTDSVFSGIGALSESDPAFVIATEIQQSAEWQRKIIEAARQRQQTFSPGSCNNSYYKRYDKRFYSLGEQGIEADGKDFEWWWIWEPEPDTDDSSMATVHDDDSILLEPGSRYCFFFKVNDAPQAHNQAVTGGESGSEDAPSSDEDNKSEPEDTPSSDEDNKSEPEDTPSSDEDNKSEPEDTPSSDEDNRNEPEDTSSSDEDNKSEPEDETDPDSGVKVTHTSTDPLPGSVEEINASYYAFIRKRIKTVPGSDDDTPVPEGIPEGIVVETETDTTACQSFNPPPAKKKK